MLYEFGNRFFGRFAVSNVVAYGLEHA